MTFRLFPALLALCLIGPLALRAGDSTRAAAEALLQRVVPRHAAQFAVEVIPSAPEGADVYELRNRGGKVVLRGNNGLSIASALHHYLKEVAGCSITHAGTNLSLPARLKPVPQPVRVVNPHRYRYYLNYCTFNYTMSWWDWSRWEQEIDWMAMNGINLPLAVTGQNSVWARVYKSLGFTDRDLEGFFSGPAYFNWFWMGNLDAWGGPLPKSWMESHEALQKKILARERALGMKPILPAFTGHVPPSFRERFPKAGLKTTSWVGFPAVNILDPSEPLFEEIGRRFIEEQTRTYGTDHLYTADTFNENKPPTDDSLYLSGMSKNVYRSIAAADTAAIWIMQGWLFHHGASFWKPRQIRALLDAVPDDRMIVLDLWSERHPVWNRTDGYYGKPWVWNMLHNFGGNVNLSGLMSSVARGPAAARAHPAARKMSGAGLTMEALGSNPVMYALMAEHFWKAEPVDLDRWLKDYTRRRYGKAHPRADSAWHLLRLSVYADSSTNGGAESIITSRPTLKANPGGTSNTALPYDAADLVRAWHHLSAAAPELKGSDGYRFDLVDVTRQVLANHASTVQQGIAKAFESGDTAAYRRGTAAFMGLLRDLDGLLATRKEFLLGPWLADARAWGTNKGESDLYERNARNLITLWGDRNSRLHEYSCRQWSGLISGFYAPRWQLFFTHLAGAMERKTSPDLKLMEEALKDWEWAWVQKTGAFPTTPAGDAVERSLQLYRRYYPQITAP